MEYSLAGKILILVAALIWGYSGVRLSIIDIKTKLLPQRIIIPTFVAVLGIYVALAIIEGEPALLGWAAVGGVGCFALFYGLYVLNPRFMGGGDVRLVGLNGFIVGWFHIGFSWLAIVVALILAFPISLILLVFKGSRSEFPFGPYLIAGTAFFLIFEVVGVLANEGMSYIF